MIEKITDWGSLVESIKAGNTDYFILVGGLARSSKMIGFADEVTDPSTIDPSTVELVVFNEIDDTEVIVNKSNFDKLTSIKRAMEAEAFYLY